MQRSPWLTASATKERERLTRIGELTLLYSTYCSTRSACFRPISCLRASDELRMMASGSTAHAEIPLADSKRD